ncbi:MAG: FTR1 family protein [Gammaproteobacteria bacterium]|nr:FTR1 family protein [Gammaproteobacteria bacterium]
MWGAAIIVFREIFEIAIIMCVVLAATRELKNRNKWIWLGIAGGSVGAVIFALITQTIAHFTGNVGQLYFNAGILFVAVIMIGWTVVWMKQHGKMIVSNMKKMSHSVAIGEKPLHILSLIIGLAVLREGSEIVVFLYGLIAAGQATWYTGLLGGILGLSLGIAFGLCMYYGLLRISMKYLFQIPSILLTLIAGGMAANAAGKLVNAGFLPAIIPSMWDTSAILSQHSLMGKFLFILIGYQDHPNGMQVIFYLITLGIIFTTAKWISRQSSVNLSTAPGKM